MIILIENFVPYHYEILESVLAKHAQILKLTEEQQKEEKKFIMNMYYDESFASYIKCKYPNIEFVHNRIKDSIPYDYYINCTYIPGLPQLVTPNKRCFYINHADLSTVNKRNHYCLTPLAGRDKYIDCDVLPFMEEPKVKNTVPIYIVQGNINTTRRNYQMLRMILDTDFGYDFKVKIVGRGEPLFGNRYTDRVIYQLNLPFQQYHREFLDAYCLLPLIHKKTNPQYYSNKMTSSINYIRAYKLKSIVDKDLQNIHSLDNAYVYRDMNGYLDAFRKTLEDFYGVEIPASKESTKHVTFDPSLETKKETINSLVPRKRVSLVKYSEKFSNLGDCLMTLSLKDFLQKHDIVVDSYHDRKSMLNGMIVNGFHCRPNEPLPKKAIYFGIFTDAAMLKNIDKGQLIGCRCIYTLDQVRRIPGLRGFITGCSTNSIEPYDGERSGEIRLMHDDLQTRYVNLPWDQQVKAAYELLDVLKKKSIVYTNRLHVALPCIALGTPVVLEKRLFRQERYSIFNTFKEFPGYGKVITKESGLRDAMRNVFIQGFEVIRKEYGL